MRNMLTTEETKNIPPKKIYPIEQLVNIIASLHKNGKRIVLAHGVFDLFHLGHLKHLEEAKKIGDILVVSLTSDKYVNKGIGRPVFKQFQRAEVIAGLSCVDFVVINDEPTSVEIIKKIKPTLYVKGKEYAQDENDITRKILDERQAVEENGGEVFYTDDVVFSSSVLINNYLGIYEPRLQAYLDEFKQEYTFDETQYYIDKIADLKVLFIGETIIDEYLYVQPMGKTPKENVIASIFKEREVFAGGVIAAAKHTANFCKSVDVLTMVGGDWEMFNIEQTLPKNIHLTTITDVAKPTIRKTRYIDKSYFSKLYEVYHMDDAPLDEQKENILRKHLHEKIKNYDLVIVTDFGHGMLNKSLREYMMNNANFLAVNTQTNSSNVGFNLISNYQKSHYFCIDAPEARLATHNKSGALADVATTLYKEHIKSSKFIITHGRYGCLSFDTTMPQLIHEVPVFTTKVVDTIGAGDAFLAITSPLVAVGAPMKIVAHVGNAVGAIKVNILGHQSSVDKIQLLKYLNAISK